MISCLIRPVEKVIVAFLITFILLFSFGCFSNSDSGSSGKKSNEKTAFAASDTVTFTTANGSIISGTVIDLDRDGKLDGIDLNNDATTLEFVFVSAASVTSNTIGMYQVDDVADGSVYAVDSNGDGTVDFYLRVLDFTSGTVELNTAADGSGSVVEVVVDNSGSVIGVDTDGDGNSDIMVISVTEVNDTTAPEPDNSGLITTANILGASLTLNWTKATDNSCPASFLKYKIVQSINNNIDTITDANTAGNGRIVIRNWTANITTVPVSGLSPVTKYYFVVLVKDAAGNMAIYQVVEQTTNQLVMTGDWIFMDGETAESLNYDTSQDASNPRMAIYDSTLFAAWSENHTYKVVGNPNDISRTQIRVKQWDGSQWSFIDGGTGWGLNYDRSKNATFPDLTASGSKLYTTWLEVWENTSNENYYNHVRVKRWDKDNGWEFIDGGIETGINANTSKDAKHPSLVVFNSKLYVIWMEPDTSAGDRIRLKEWAGTSWNFIDDFNAIPKGLNYDPLYTGCNSRIIKSVADSPRLFVFDSKLYATWSEKSCIANIQYQFQIRVREFNGTDWTFVDSSSDTGLNYDASHDAFNPQLVEHDSKLYAAWSETNSSAIKQIRVKQWSGTDWSFVDGSSDTGLNYDSSHTADFPQMISFDSKLYAAWSEFDGSDYLIRVKEWDGTTWTFVDSDGAEGLVYDSSPSTAVAHPQMIQYQSRLYIIWEEENSAVAQKKQIRIKQAEME